MAVDKARCDDVNDVMTLDLKNVYPPQHGFISIMYSVTVSGS